MINNMISIPVHEKTEVVIDQIINYKTFLPNCGIVLHISKSFNYNDSFHNENEFMFILSTFENVFINPKHLDTSFADIVHTHVANFEYVSQVTDFEYFSMVASNDLFVRHMPEIKEYDANFTDDVFVEMKDWPWYERTYHDEYLRYIVNYLNGNISDIRMSQIEGSFYKKELFQQIVDIINKVYNYEEVLTKNRIIYPREEVYYPTIANILSKGLKNKNLNYTFVAWNNPNYLPTNQEIIDIAQGKIEGKYSIKRVLRTINDPVRFKIGVDMGHYREKTMELVKSKITKIYRNLFNLSSERRRIFVGHKEEENFIRNVFKIKTIETFLPFKINEGGIFFVDELLSTMDRNRDALFVIFTKNYPIIYNFLIQHGFRENIEFIDGTLLVD